ncbi:MAG: energy transducer TonB [Rhodoferax sp.]|nr:energy transducer TonB [Rhodoferax sp.]
MSTSALPRPSALPAMSRNTTIVISVIALHVAVLWAMQTGLLRRVAEAVVPAEILVEIMAPPAPPTPEPKPQPQPKVQVKAPTPKPVAPTPTPPLAQQPAPTPLAIAPSATAPAPSAAAPTAIAGATASANSGSTSNAPPAPPAPPKVELPSSDADYLNNPKPPYPTPQQSLARARQGGGPRVHWHRRTRPRKPPSKRPVASSAWTRPQVNTVLKWRYVPGKRGGVAEAMWFDVPVNWVLQ